MFRFCQQKAKSGLCIWGRVLNAIKCRSSVRAIIISALAATISLSLYSFRLLSPPTTSVKVYGPCICGNVACQCILAFTLRFRVGIHVIPLTQTTSAGREKGRALTLMAEACMCVCVGGWSGFWCICSNGFCVGILR